MEGVLIRLIARILVIAFMVGFTQSVGAVAAFAPKENLSFLKEPKLYAKFAVNNSRQYECLNELWTHESHWNPKAANPHSTAFGIPQFLDSTWRNYNYPVRPKDPILQIKAGLRYITVRYGTPCKAWSFWKLQQRRGNAWY